MNPHFMADTQLVKRGNAVLQCLNWEAEVGAYVFTSQFEATATETPTVQERCW